MRTIPKATQLDRLSSTVTALLFLCCCLLYLPLAYALELEDDRGQVLHLLKPPQRIVSILPSLAEFVCALDQCHRLVGIDRYTSWPSKLNQLPRVGSGLSPDIETIVALRPDLVLASTSSGRAAEHLTALKIPVLTLRTESYTDAQRVLQKLGLALGVPDIQVKRVWDTIRAGVANAAQAIPSRARKAKVYFEVDPAPYGAGEGSFIGEILSRLGVKNILPLALGPFPKLNPEFIARADPDVIMIGVRSAPSLSQRPGWGTMRAVRENRICTFSSAELDILARPGPRLPEAARLMAHCLSEKAP